MESVVKGLFKVRWKPQLQFVRCNTKVNVTRPRPPHFERALVEKLCLPYFSKQKKPKYVPNFETCVGPPVFKSRIDEDHPYIKILAEDNVKYFNNSKLIAFFHINALTPEEKFAAQLVTKKAGMKLLFLSKIVLKKALTGTPFEVVLSLYKSPTATVFSPKPDIQKLMSIQKKTPKLILMGAVVENRLLNLTDLTAYAEFKDIIDARQYLVSTINSASQHIVQQINCYPNNLMGLLDHHKKLLKESNS